MTMKAHQKIIRDKAAELDKHNLFGEWWNEYDMSPSKAVVREVQREAVAPIIEKYEWLGNVPDNCNHFVGLFFENQALGGAVAFTHQFFGGKYKLYEKRAVVLSRGATLHFAPKWASSFLIARAIKLLYGEEEPLYVMGFSDWRAGEIGTIYQACNWFYLGHNTTSEWISPSGERRDPSFHKIRVVSGSRHKATGRRATKKQYQAEAERMVKEGWQLIRNIKRGRYATVAGQRGKIYREMRETLKRKSKPYPKRVCQMRQKTLKHRGDNRAR